MKNPRVIKSDNKTISQGDILVVNIDHETKSFRKSYKFNGSDVALKDSISFRVKGYGTSIEISWSGAPLIGNRIIFVENNTFTQQLFKKTHKCYSI